MNAQETVMLMSCHQHEEQNRDLKMVDKFSEMLVKFKCLEQQ
jgi:hypothetical protein